MEECSKVCSFPFNFFFHSLFLFLLCPLLLVHFSFSLTFVFILDSLPRNQSCNCVDSISSPPGAEEMSSFHLLSVPSLIHFLSYTFLFIPFQCSPLLPHCFQLNLSPVPFPLLLFLIHLISVRDFIILAREETTSAAHHTKDTKSHTDGEHHTDQHHRRRVTGFIN